MNAYTPKTDEDLKTLARNCCEGRIFLSTMIRNPPDIGLVFMSVGLAVGIADWCADNNITMVYEYISEAGPRSINGYPTFMSARFLNRTDHQKLMENVDQYMKLQESYSGASQ